MHRIRKFGALAMVLLVGAACSDQDQPMAPESDSPSVTISASHLDAGDVTTETLLAGQDIPVGELSVEHLGEGMVEVTYQMFSDFCLAETHWEATTDAGSLTNRGGNPQIGKFAFGDDDLDCATSYTEEGAITGWTSTDDDYVVAAHAVVTGAGGDENPNVVFGTFDQDGDGAEEGDIYGVNPTSGNLVLVAEIANDEGNDPFYPNGLALDRDAEELFYVTDSEDLYKVPAENADPTSVTRTPVRSGLEGGLIRSGTIDGDHYYYVPNGTEELWRLPKDGSSAASSYCDLDAPGTGLFFGDIAADPDNPGTIYGTARIDNGTNGTLQFFEIDVDGVDDCVENGGTFSEPSTYDFQLQLAFGADGTLYGQEALSEPQGDNPGQWHILDSATGETTSTLAQTERSFTDIAGGLPFEPVEFDETAWAEGDRFTQRGNWAMFMGPFNLSESH